ncbi:MAG: DUF4870 domain-containing protein, partial [bacterium]|nr:DUF4870 domain-containing protein [bacterium]
PYGAPRDPYGAPGDPYGRPHDSYGSEGWERRGHPGDPVLGQSRDMSPGEEKTWAVLAHVAAPIATLLSAGWLGFVAPLLIWVFFRGRSEFVRVAAARSFNFNLLLFLANAAAWLLFFSIIGIPFAIAIWIGAFIGMLVFHISAAMDAGRGILYRYPISVPILR